MVMIRDHVLCARGNRGPGYRVHLAGTEGGRARRDPELTCVPSGCGFSRDEIFGEVVDGPLKEDQHSPFISLLPRDRLRLSSPSARPATPVRLGKLRTIESMTPSHDPP